MESTAKSPTLTTDSDSPDPGAETGLRLEFVRLFVHLAHVFGLPRSIGEIYGTVFASPQPICFEEIMRDSGVSKGSVSTGLRTLQRIGAVRSVPVPGDRRSFFEPEVQMRRLVDGFLRESLGPNLISSTEQLARITDRLASAEDLADREALERRVATLRVWFEKARDFLPLIQQLAEPDPGSDPPS